MGHPSKLALKTCVSATICSDPHTSQLSWPRNARRKRQYVPVKASKVMPDATPVAVTGMNSGGGDGTPRGTGVGIVTGTGTGVGTGTGTGVGAGTGTGIGVGVGAGSVGTGVTAVGVGTATRGVTGALVGVRRGGGGLCVGLGHVLTLTLEQTLVVFLAPFLGCFTGTVLHTRLVVVLHADRAGQAVQR